MSVVISMLRGVNVGGHNKLKMDLLRALYASLGLPDAQTYIQSGNVVFRTGAKDLAPLSSRIQKGIERSFGFRPEVVLRTASEMRKVLASNPMAGRRDFDASKLLVTFLAGDPSPDARTRILGLNPDPEELWLHGRELYVHYPEGLGRSKLSPALIERTLKTSGTGRNWNTVVKLLEIADGLEGPRKGAAR